MSRFLSLCLSLSFLLVFSSLLHFRFTRGVFDKKSWEFFSFVLFIKNRSAVSSFLKKGVDRETCSRWAMKRRSSLDKKARWSLKFFDSASWERASQSFHLFILFISSLVFFSLHAGVGFACHGVHAFMPSFKYDSQVSSSLSVSLSLLAVFLSFFPLLFPLASPQEHFLSLLCKELSSELEQGLISPSLSLFFSPLFFFESRPLAG